MTRRGRYYTASEAVPKADYNGRVLPVQSSAFSAIMWSMRVLAIAPTGFFADYGCHVRILGQLRALQALGYEVRLVTYPVGSDVPGLSTVRPPWPLTRRLAVGSSYRKLLLDLLLAPTATWVGLRFRPQLIHGYLHEGVLIGWVLARRLGIPLTADYQGSLTAEMLDHRFLSPRSPMLPLLRRLERWIDTRPAALFPSSLQAAQRLRHVAQERIHPLADSVDPEVFAPAPPDSALRDRLGLDPDRPLVVYLGLLAPYQGIDWLLHAIAAPPLRGHKAQFLIMGFPHVQHYRGMARRLGIADRVRFTGAVPYELAPRYLALGDIAVAPKLSATEGSGKLLPYMSMALPVVASDIPVHRQYLGDAGVYVSPGDEQALAEALAETCRRLPDLRRRAFELRRRVEEKYTWHHAAKAMAEVFQTLVVERGTGPG
ncbi:MAG: glycosyltransferase family 1 protein [Caldilineae bacterium]|nr:MAG: glycosyltransferase family 1 protein [Caldilineae bacterium]